MELKFKNDEEQWKYIEEQEDILNQLGTALANLKRAPESHDTVEELEGRAVKGDSAAQFNLSIRLLYGEGVRQDHEQAARWLLQSAESGYAHAQYDLGCCLQDGGDTQNALPWFIKAAKQNYGPAQYNLAVIYGNLGDHHSAFIWFSVAAQNGVAEASSARKKAAGFLTTAELDPARMAASALMFDLRRQR